jgi:hypothetical protein
MATSPNSSIWSLYLAPLLYASGSPAVCKRFSTSAETTGLTAALSQLGVNNMPNRTKSSAVVTTIHALLKCHRESDYVASGLGRSYCPKHAPQRSLPRSCFQSVRQSPRRSGLRLRNSGNDIRGLRLRSFRLLLSISSQSSTFPVDGLGEPNSALKNFTMMEVGSTMASIVSSS